MGDIGIAEILIIIVVGIIAYGKDLPGVAKKIGSTYAKVKRKINDIKWDIEKQIEEAGSSADEIKSEVASIPEDIKSEVSAGLQDIDKEKAEETVTPKEDVIRNDSSTPKQEKGD